MILNSNELIPNPFNTFINKPITIFTITTLLVIYLLQLFNIIKIYTCNHTFVDVLKSNFIHTDFLHLFFNTTTLLYLSTIEYELGTLKFTILLDFYIINY